MPELIEPQGERIFKMAKITFFVNVIWLIIVLVFYEKVAERLEVKPINLFIFGTTTASTTFTLLAIYGLFAPAKYFPKRRG